MTGMNLSEETDTYVNKPKPKQLIMNSLLKLDLKEKNDTMTDS